MPTNFRGCFWGCQSICFLSRFRSPDPKPLVPVRNRLIMEQEEPTGFVPSSCTSDGLYYTIVTSKHISFQSGEERVHVTCLRQEFIQRDTRTRGPFVSISLWHRVVMQCHFYSLWIVKKPRDWALQQKTMKGSRVASWRVWVMCALLVHVYIVAAFLSI